MIEISSQINSQIAEVILAVFCVFLLVAALKLARARCLLASSVYLSLSSAFIACLYLLMDAPDVAITEVALGTCLSTSALLNFLKKINYSQISSKASAHHYRWKNVLIGIFCFISFLVMALIYLDLPIYGQMDTPVQGGISNYYLNNTYQQIGIPAVVTAILAAYRGFDTLGETSVILIGGLGSLLLLPNQVLNQAASSSKLPTNNLGQHLILKIVTNFIFSFIILYSFYIQLNGEASPGGGFQAGAIFASGLIAYDLIYAKQKAAPALQTLTFIAVFGVLLYFSVGAISLIFGDNYLDYYSLNFIGINGQVLGIFLVELGVGFTVAATLSLIYFLFGKS